jgi:hypothetical protein
LSIWEHPATYQTQIPNTQCRFGSGRGTESRLYRVEVQAFRSFPDIGVLVIQAVR